MMKENISLKIESTKYYLSMKKTIIGNFLIILKDTWSF